MTPPDAALAPAPTLDRAGFAALVAATPEQMADLDAYLVLLAARNEQMNLVGPSALAEFWSRHVLDSVQLLQHMPDAKTWADVGAGGGFPGIVLAIFLKGVPGAKVHLIESMTKRCRFLQEVADALGLPAVVHNARAENLDLSPVEVVTARACAPFPRLLGYVAPLMRKGAVGLFLKGSNAAAELEEAARQWRFDARLMESRSDPSGRIVRLEKLSRV
jgi:16S rRNA (guanine527-N7)-methyltransferase